MHVLSVKGDLRFDDIKDIELSHTLNRKTTLDYIQLGDVYQRNMNAFFNAEIDLGKFSITTGLRVEYFNFQYNNKLSEAYDLQTNTEVAVLP